MEERNLVDIVFLEEENYKVLKTVIAGTELCFEGKVSKVK